MTDRREGLALLAGEVVVVALALVLVAAGPNVDPVALANHRLPPAVLGATLLVAGAGLGALRTVETEDARTALGELGLGTAIALAIAADANPIVVGIAAAVGVASITLRVDSDRIHNVLER